MLDRIAVVCEIVALYAPYFGQADVLNPLMGTLILHSNGPLYSSTVIGTLAVDGWTVTFGTASPLLLYQM